MNYNDAIKFYPDFPIPGVNFVDVIPFLQDRELFRSITRDLGVLCASPNVAAPEARGFLFATPLLIECPNVRNIIPIRQKGKLPFAEGDLVTVDIVKEYGKDQVFYRLSDLAAGKPEGDVIPLTFFDDILATGGTARGIVESLNGRKVTVDGKEYGVKVLLHIDWFCAVNSRHAIDLLMANTDPALVGLCLDTAELAMVGLDPVEIYEAHADRVELFHFNQILVADTLEEYKKPLAELIMMDGGEREIDRWFWELGAPEGPGLVDHEALMRSIKAHGYDGWIIVETRQTPDAHDTCMFDSWYVNHVLKKV